MVYTYTWWIIRISALLTVPSFLYDVEILFLVISFLVIHLTMGLKTIFQDYLHDKTSKVLLITLMRVTSLEFLRSILELLI